jgi:hypothetical protein
VSFADAAKMALANLYSTEKFGVEATFTPLTGDPDTFNVILGVDNSYQPGGSVQVAEPQTTISYQRTNLDRKVKRGETFTIDGMIYTVRSMADYPDSWTEYEGKASVEAE